ncbi:hypothetical protein ACDX66_02235 [Peribacillus frigoritolerans]
MEMKNGLIKRRRTFGEIELTAEDISDAIETLSNEEKWKLKKYFLDTTTNMESNEEIQLQQIIKTLNELKKNMDERFDQLEEKIDQSRQKNISSHN